MHSVPFKLCDWASALPSSHTKHPPHPKKRNNSTSRVSEKLEHMGQSEPLSIVRKQIMLMSFSFNFWCRPLLSIDWTIFECPEKRFIKTDTHTWGLSHMGLSCTVVNKLQSGFYFCRWVPVHLGQNPAYVSSFSCRRKSTGSLACLWIW